jgi:hypothetical protein
MTESVDVRAGGRASWEPVSIVERGMPGLAGQPGHYRVHFAMTLSSAPDSYWRLAFEEALLVESRAMNFSPHSVHRPRISGTELSWDFDEADFDEAWRCLTAAIAQANAVYPEGLAEREERSRQHEAEARARAEREAELKRRLDELP